MKDQYDKPDMLFHARPCFMATRQSCSVKR